MHMLSKVILCLISFCLSSHACAPERFELDTTQNLLVFSRKIRQPDTFLAQVDIQNPRLFRLGKQFTFKDQGFTTAAFVNPTKSNIFAVRTYEENKNTLYSVSKDGINPLISDFYKGTNASFSSHDGAILCTGGNKYGQTQNSAFLMDEETLAIQHLAPMIQGRSSHTSIFDPSHNRWVVFGGSNNYYNTVKSIQSFDERSNQWKEIDLPKETTDLLSYIGGSTVITPQNTIILTGGYPQEDQYKPVHTLTPRREQYVFDFSSLSLQKLPHDCYEMMQPCYGVPLEKYYGVYSWGQSQSISIYDGMTGKYMDFAELSCSEIQGPLFLNITGTALSDALDEKTE